MDTTISKIIDEYMEKGVNLVVLNKEEVIDILKILERLKRKLQELIKT